MISITVHHHHHRQPAQLHQMSRCSLATFNKSSDSDNSSTSSVQVEYLGGHFRSAAKTNNVETEAKRVFADQNNQMKDFEEKQQQQDGSKKLEEQQQQQKPVKNLHSRSISLIINPDFQLHGGENQAAKLVRRRSLPRFTRRARHLADQAKRQQQQQQHQVDQTTTTTGATEKQEEQEEEERPKKGLLSRSEANFREAGILLRKISEEFAKFRRRTI